MHFLERYIDTFAIESTNVTELTQSEKKFLTLHTLSWAQISSVVCVIRYRVRTQEAGIRLVVSGLCSLWSSALWVFLWHSLPATILSKSLSASLSPSAFPMPFPSPPVLPLIYTSVSPCLLLGPWDPRVSYCWQRKPEWSVYSNFGLGHPQSLYLTAFKNKEESS